MDDSIVDTSMAVDHLPSDPPHSSLSPPLFKGITYLLSTSLPPTRRAVVELLLQQFGGTPANELGVRDPKLTTVITKSGSLRWEGWDVLQKLEEEEEKEWKSREGEASRKKRRNKVEVVSDSWVERSLLADILQSAHHFSVDPALIFSGVIACATDLPACDLEVLAAGISALGGQWRTGLTRDVTHLFATQPGCPKYETAMHFTDQTRIKVVTPHWFDDAVRLGNGKLGTEEYEWPDPRVLKGVDGVGKEKDKDGEDKEITEEELVKQNIYTTAALFTPAKDQTTPPAEADLSMGLALSSSGLNGFSNKDPDLSGSTVAPTGTIHVWAGRRVLLSRTLQLYGSRRSGVAAGIERAGGIVVRFDGDEDEEEPECEVTVELKSDTKGNSPDGQRVTNKVFRLHRNERERRKREAEKVAECDVLVTRWRYGRAYVNAVRAAKTIGTLAWLFHVQTTGILARPLDQLLHYPVPKRNVEGFHGHTVTVTNYTGEAREYLKKIITTMGASFTPSMSGQNTVLVAAYISGTKATKARAWSIPVVNHTWLEDCFVQWRNLTVALEKYVVFPPGVDFSTLLGERGVFVGGSAAGDPESGALGRIEQEAEELAEDDEELADVLEGEVDLELVPPNGTEAAEMKEVQGLVEDVDVDVVMDDGPPPVDLMDDDWDFGAGKAAKENADQERHVPATSSAKKQTNGRKRHFVPEVVLTSSKSPTKSTQRPDTTKLASTSKAKVPADPDILELSDEATGEEDEPASVAVKKGPPKSAKKQPSASAVSAKKKKTIEHQEEDEEDDGEDEELRPAKTSSKKKSSKRRAVLGSSDEEEDAMDVDIAERSRQQEQDSDGSHRPAVKVKTSAKPLVKTVPAKKGATSKGSKAKPVVESDDDEDIEIISAPKAKPKAKPSAELSAPPSTLLSKPKGDARTRVKRMKKVQETKAVESESEEVKEQEKKAKGKGKPATKVAAKKKGKGRMLESESEEQFEPESEDEEEEEEEEEERPIRPTRQSTIAAASSVKPTLTAQSTSKSASEATPKSKAPPDTPTRSKPLRVYSTDDLGVDDDEDEDEDDEEDKRHENGNSNDSDDSLPAAPRFMTKAEKRAAEAAAKEKEKAKEKASSFSKAKPKPATLAKTSAKSNSKGKKVVPPASATESEVEEDNQVVVSASRTAAKTPTSTKNPQRSSTTNGPSTPKRIMSVLMPSLNLSGHGSGAKSKADPITKASSGSRAIRKGKGHASEDEEDEEVAVKEVVVPRGKDKAKPVTTIAKAAAKSSKARANAKAAFSDDEDDEEQEEEEVSILVSPRSRGVPRTRSLHAVSGQISSSAVRSTPTATKANASSAKDKAPTQSGSKSAAGPSSKKPTSTRAPAPMDVDSLEESTIMSAPLPKRSAAAKATQRLHDIMPDVNAFEVQQRKAADKVRRGSRMSMDAFKVDGEGSLDDLFVGGRSRKRGAKRVDDDEEEEDVGGEKRTKKKRRVSAQDDDAEIEDMDAKKAAKGKAKEKSAPMDVDDNVAGGIMVMTTQVTLGDDVIKALIKLGIKMTTRPSECTHLLAQHVVRTEKFLCALTRAPWILSEKWALASAEANKLLPETEFVLKDKAGETKYGVNLANALRRAKANNGKLMAGHIFYVTPRVPVDTKLLKNVVTACGGQVTTQTPTTRIINAASDTRHVISCREDMTIWRSLATAGIRVYTQELLLNGTLRQEMEWDNKEFHVQI